MNYKSYLFKSLAIIGVICFIGCNHDESPSKTTKSQPKTEKSTQKEAAKELQELAQITTDKIKAQLEKLKAQSEISKVVGLENCGNTCYMNSLLQALLHSDLGRYTRVPLSDIAFAQGINKEKSLFKLFYDLAKDYRTTPNTWVPTQTIAQARRNFMPDLKPGAQADANEYLNLFLERLGVELNAITSPLPEKFKEPSDAEQANFSYKYNWFLSGGISEYSIVQDLFGGFVQNVINKTNGTKIQNYELFTTLTLELPKSNTEVSLENLLENYSKEEVLSDSPGNKSKKITLYKAPKTLIVHLKRFEQQSSGYFKKLNTKVKYPDVLSLSTPVDGSVEFDLFAIVIHSGSLTGGHYTAQIKTPDNKWYDASDRNIQQSNASNALGQNTGAYMLFYKKR